MEEDDVALADFDALLFGGADDVLLRIGPALFNHVDAVTARHVEQDAARYGRRHVLDAGLGRPVGLGEVAILVAVIVDVVDADMAEPVDLWPDAEPAHVDAVVVGHGVFAEIGRGGLIGLENADAERPRRKGRRLGIDDDAEVVGLAGRDELCRRHGRFLGNEIGGADLVVRSPLRFRPVLLGYDRRGQQRSRHCQACYPAPFTKHVNHPLPDRTASQIPDGPIVG